jgi:hypothetical protein
MCLCFSFIQQVIIGTAPSDFEFGSLVGGHKIANRSVQNLLHAMLSKKLHKLWQKCDQRYRLQVWVHNCGLISSTRACVTLVTHFALLWCQSLSHCYICAKIKWNYSRFHSPAESRRKFFRVSEEPERSRHIWADVSRSSGGSEFDSPKCTFLKFFYMHCVSHFLFFKIDFTFK